MFARRAHFQPLPLLTSNTVAFVWNSITCAACGCLYLRVPTQAVWVSYLSWPDAFAFFICTLVRVHSCIWHVRVRGRVTQCLLCTLALFVPGASCLQGMLYEKGRLVELSARASEFICIRSTACLSSEPILITTRSGLLQHCTYTLSE